MNGPLVDLVWALVGVILLCWGLSVVTREYSWVDRLWSILPPAYVGFLAWDAGFASPRVNLMLGLSLAWGVRLTFNFWRKGGYEKGGEDYRWAILRERLGPVGFQVFNATFIAPYQMFLVWLIAMPAYTAWQHRDAPLGVADWALAVVFLVLLGVEFVADQQQWDFQRAKAAKVAAGEPVSQRFANTGLWAMSRHPNFFAEMGQWWVFYGFAVAASGQWLNWTVLGAALLTLLFDGSTRFTESITLSKYPEYAAYQRTTSRWIPRPPRA